MLKNSGKTKMTNLLALAALGVVFGDLGTSPLYAVQAVFGTRPNELTAGNVRGLISLILWVIIIVACVKYLSLLMRASNRGEGGVMALITLLKGAKLPRRRMTALTLVGLLGVALFYGDGMITPAISVISAVGGLGYISHGFNSLIVPISVVILIILFAVQHKGTGWVGKYFGPVMVVWFVVSAVGGLPQIIKHPGVLIALAPTSAISFFVSHPLFAFTAMGAVVLAVTGVEALYADMGHFGRQPIARAWFFLVFPALVINYLGQGALVVHSPGAAASPYFLLFPSAIRWAVVILAAAATFIASQSVIAGTFSLTRQAIHLDFAPRMRINHTSAEEAGQIYIGALNWTLAVAVILLVIIFGSSARLAGAYGVAVSGTLLIDTLLFLVLLKVLWRRASWQVGLVALVLLPIDLLLVISSLGKVPRGGWIPLAVAAAALAILTTWAKGHKIISSERHQMEGSLETFIRDLAHRKHVARIPGSAIYLSHSVKMAPLALHRALDELHELAEHVIVASVLVLDHPHVPEDERVVVEQLGSPADGVTHLTLSFGFKDSINVPRTLELVRDRLGFDFSPEDSPYFISQTKPVIEHGHRLAYWRKLLFKALARNETSPTDYYKLPPGRTFEVSSLVKL